MTAPSFPEQRDAWRRIPVDDVGYLDATHLLALPDHELKALVMAMEQVRYRGWRNYENRWRSALGLDSTHGKRVLDYGCGVGLEALQYAKAGNEVWLADINPGSIDVATRVLALFGSPAAGATLITAAPRPVPGPLWPGLPLDLRFDVIHCAGVLHHIPFPRYTMEGFRRALKPRGELRLMVYSGQAWRTAVGTDPPNDVAADPGFARYIEHMDGVGAWADWYDQERLETRFGDLFTVAKVEPLGPVGQYLAVVLTPKRKAKR